MNTIRFLALHGNGEGRVDGSEMLTCDAEVGKTLLRTGIENGLNLWWACNAGDCRKCRCVVLSGEEHLRPKHGFTNIRGEGDVLACVAEVAQPGNIEVKIGTLNRPSSDRLPD